MIPFHGCGVALATGLGAHVIFDVATYVLAITVGIKIGCRKHKHEPKEMDCGCANPDHMKPGPDWNTHGVPWREPGSRPHLATCASAGCERDLVYKDGDGDYWCRECKIDVEQYQEKVMGLPDHERTAFTRFREL